MRVSVVAALLAAACSTDAPVEPGADYRIVVVSGDNQLGHSLAPLAAPLTVRIEDANGAGVRGVRVNFRIDRATSATASLVDSVAVSDAEGLARAWLTLGLDTATNADADRSTVVVRSWIAAAPWRAVRFSATREGTGRLDSVSPTTVQAGDELVFRGSMIGGHDVRAHFGDIVVRVGGGIVAVGDTGAVRVPACVQPGTVDFRLESDGRPSNALPLTVRAERATLALAPYEHVTLPASRVADCISLPGDGASYLVTAQFASVGSPEAVDWEVGADGPGASALLRGAPFAAKPPVRNEVHRAFEASLRRMERETAPAVRAARGATMATASLAAPPIEGSLRSFRVVAATDGAAFETVTARLRFVGKHLLVYSDTTDNGFGDEQLIPMVTLFDRDLYGAAVNAFGADPDIDRNGRVVVLFTPTINRMSRAEDCLLRGYVTGFFYPVDHYERAPDSNRGEIFYSYVPDPLGRHSCPHTEAEVVRTLQPTFLHEMQHLISFNERVLARGVEVEETWLNEGLSQIAEELGSRVFEARYPAPLGRSTTAQLFPDSAAPFIAPNMLHAYTYLTFPLQNSLTSFRGAGTFEERGGAWLFLRWLADQKGDQVLRRLVQGSRRGAANIEAVAGESLGALFGDFSLALFTDSLPGYPRAVVPPRLRFASRNVRQLMARQATITGFPDPFPLATYLLAQGGSLRASMPAGTMVHAIVQSDPGGPPVRLGFRSPTGAAFPAALGAQVSIVRLPP